MKIAAGLARRDLFRWGAAAAVASGFHVAAFAFGYGWHSKDLATSSSTPTFMVTLEPVPEAPQNSLREADQGPPMDQAPPDASNATIPENHNPIELPKASLPDALPASTPTEKAKVEPDTLQRPSKQKTTSAKPPEPDKRPPAPRTSAPPKVVQLAHAAAPADIGPRAPTISPSNYQSEISAYVSRFKQYPSEARASGVHGTANVHFTFTRSGQILSASLARSSGTASLDQEAVATVRRAHPLPAPPPDYPASGLSLTIPIRFNIN